MNIAHILTDAGKAVTIRPGSATATVVAWIEEIEQGRESKDTRDQPVNSSKHSFEEVFFFSDVGMNVQSLVKYNDTLVTVIKEFSSDKKIISA